MSGARHIFNARFACCDGLPGSFDKLESKFSRSTGEHQGTECFAIFVHKRLLTKAGTPCSASSNDGSQNDRLFTLQSIVNDLGEVLHAWLSWDCCVMPRLHKHIKDTTADALALHGDFLGKINLHHAGTLRVDYIEGAAPYFGLTTAATHGAADLAAAMHQHLCSNFTWHRAFALDDGCQGDCFTGCQFSYYFLKEFAHVVISCWSSGSSKN